MSYGQRHGDDTLSAFASCQSVYTFSPSKVVCEAAERVHVPQVSLLQQWPGPCAARCCCCWPVRTRKTCILGTYLLALRVGSRARLQQLLTSVDLSISACAVVASSSSIYAQSVDQLHAAGERSCGEVPAALLGHCWLPMFAVAADG